MNFWAALIIADPGAAPVSRAVIVCAGPWPHGACCTTATTEGLH